MKKWTKKFKDLKIGDSFVTVVDFHSVLITTRQRVQKASEIGAKYSITVKEKIVTVTRKEDEKDTI